MYVKIHKSGESEIVAISDEGLIGKVIEDEKARIEVTERFYKGKRVNDEEIKEILKTAKTVNVVGEESVNLCINLGLIEKENVLKIKGVPHAQFITA